MCSSPPAGPCSDSATPSVAAIVSGPYAGANAMPLHAERQEGAVGGHRHGCCHLVAPPRVEYELTPLGGTCTRPSARW
ncbi:conserved hypothetical protein [Streptomyces sviceus ATCC 29083]|uniref:Uncharacterized protein n=1 Tax=Streptomyces sviceus (strain ATCC 29083 / DSM 924 / JCM 4929 / NBRC 13980 / NCIMB 11184 / NRRL 5439 / UC 5370) TaxID=463191 RepID=B5HQ91_STRX2|nr:conserved hypothetical protein [Streptomyces sviceus ATCC 29083]